MSSAAGGAFRVSVLHFMHLTEREAEKHALAVALDAFPENRANPFDPT